MHSRTTTLCEKLELALEHHLVDFCYLTRKAVVLSMGGHPLSYSHEEARSFLDVLLKGWAQYQKPSGGKSTQEGVVEASAAPVIEQAESILAPQPPSGEAVPEPERAAEPAQEEGPAEEVPAPTDEPAEAPPVQPSEGYIDAVLAFAEAMRLIESFDKDDRTHKVTLRTSAATTEMSYFDTLEYLTTSILEELRMGEDR